MSTIREDFEAWKRAQADGFDAWDAVLWAAERAARTDMATLHTDLEALMPEPVGFRTRYRSEPEMIGHYPWTYADAARRRRKYDRPACEYEDLYTADQMRKMFEAGRASIARHGGESFEQWAKERGHPLCDVVPKYGPASSSPETVLRFSDIAREAWDAATERAAKLERSDGVLIAAYALPVAPGVIDQVRIERARQMFGPDLWAIRRNGDVLNKEGEWEWEPMPSSRDDAFLARARFATADEAIAAAIRAGGEQS